MHVRDVLMLLTLMFWVLILPKIEFGWVWSSHEFISTSWSLAYDNEGGVRSDWSEMGNMLLVRSTYMVGSWELLLART